MITLAVLISNAGIGTNLQAIIDAIQAKELNAKISIVVSDTEDAHGLLRAKQAGTPMCVLKKGELLEKILKEKFPVDYVVLAGWKQIISENLIDAFYQRIINIHPGLIPDRLNATVQNPDGTTGLWNRGKFAEKAIQHFFDTHATYAGSSVHFLSHQFDFGKVIARCFEKIKKTDTIESLYRRLKVKENKILIGALQKI